MSIIWLSRAVLSNDIDEFCLWIAILTPRSTNGPAATIWLIFRLGCLLHVLFLCHASSFCVCQRKSSEEVLHTGLVASSIFSKYVLESLDGLHTFVWTLCGWRNIMLIAICPQSSEAGWNTAKCPGIFSIYQEISWIWKSAENTLSWEIAISISQKTTSLCGLKLKKCLRMRGWEVEVTRFGFASCLDQEGSWMVSSFIHVNNPGNLEISTDPWSLALSIRQEQESVW